MVFLILNIIALISFVFITFYIDKKLQIDSSDGNALMVPALLAVVESALLVITLIFKDLWLTSMTKWVLKIVFCVDAIFFVNFSFMMISVALKKKKTVFFLIKLALCALGAAIVIGHFNSIDIDENYSLIIGSEYLLSMEASEYFPWTWVTLFHAFFKFFLPSVCFIFAMLIQEKKDADLGRYQMLLIGESVLLMWILIIYFQFMENVSPAFSTLFPFSYLFMLVLTLSAVTTTSIPTFRGGFLKFLRILATGIIPALLVGAVAMFLQPKTPGFNLNYTIIMVLVTAAAILFVMKGSELLSNSNRLYNADYGPAMEKDLAAINYNEDMDIIAAKMYDIFRRRVEASSMNVYVLNNDGILDTAYTSNGFTTQISPSNPIFNHLLNVNKSIVSFVELENVHEISSIEEPLREFFDKTKSDALFILNEGRNIFGLITLGRKLSGDHYKEYDYNVFSRLYSYFFVFGYYMRNISNKDVISVVNRELRMSSQIITSIQENIEHIKNKKVDTGYLMVPSHNIGGEFVDLIRLTDTRHLFVVGDLSGKGIAASMNMVILKSIIRSYLAEIHDFKELVVRVNAFVRESLPKGTIFSGLFALVDFETDTLYYINCGIPALFLYTRVYNNVIEIQGGGHVLGFVKDLTPYVSVKTTKLSRGDIILACTDGLVNSHSLRGEQFGKERIQQAILDNSTYTAQRMAQFTFDSLLKFMSKEMEDDVSILVLKYETSLEFANGENGEGEADEFNLPEESILGIPAADTVEPAVVENKAETPAKEAPVEETNEPAPENPDEAFVKEVIADMDIPDVPDDIPSFDEGIAEQPVEATEEPAAQEAAETENAPASEEAPAEENAATEEKPADEFTDPDIPDLSNLDEMLKMAGL